MVETILIKDKIRPSLELNSAAVAFLEDVDKLKDNDILIDFEGVKFVSRSFAQSYFAKKQDMSKNINEIHLPDEVKPLMDMIRKQLE